MFILINENIELWLISWKYMIFFQLLDFYPVMCLSTKKMGIPSDYPGQAGDNNRQQIR